jgi:hypothetical protein
MEAVAVERRCPRCGKRLARLNPGPTCFACEPFEREQPRAQLRSRRRRLPYDQVIGLYQEIGDVTQVANRLGLPRSSVWYAIHRAKREVSTSEAGRSA